MTSKNGKKKAGLKFFWKTVSQFWTPREYLLMQERAKRIKGKSRSELYPYYGATGEVGLIDDFIFEGEHL